MREPRAEQIHPRGQSPIQHGAVGIDHRARERMRLPMAHRASCQIASAGCRRWRFCRGLHRPDPHKHTLYSAHHLGDSDVPHPHDPGPFNDKIQFHRFAPISLVEQKRRCLTDPTLGASNGLF
jgi:hypothetical protein